MAWDYKHTFSRRYPQTRLHDDPAIAEDRLDAIARVATLSPLRNTRWHVLFIRWMEWKEYKLGTARWHYIVERLSTQQLESLLFNGFPEHSPLRVGIDLEYHRRRDAKREVEMRAVLIQSKMRDAFVNRVLEPGLVGAIAAFATGRVTGRHVPHVPYSGPLPPHADVLHRVRSRLRLMQADGLHHSQMQQSTESCSSLEPSAKKQRTQHM
jgi:hypothetical protein